MAHSISSKSECEHISVGAELPLEVLMNTRVRACLLLAALPLPALPLSRFWWTGAQSTLPRRQRRATEAECGTERIFLTHATDLLILSEETGSWFRI